MRARLPEGSKRSSWSRCRVCAVLGFLLFLGPPTVSQGLIMYLRLDSVVLRVEGSGPQLSVSGLRPPPLHPSQGQQAKVRGGTGTALVQNIKPLRSFPPALTDPSKCSESMSVPLSPQGWGITTMGLWFSVPQISHGCWIRPLEGGESSQ